MRVFTLLAIAALAPGAAHAQADAAPQSLTLAGKTWRVAAQEGRVERHLGRDSLALKSGYLWLDQENFSDGVIEFDVAYNEAESFIGAMWRAERDDRYEDIYVRAHLNRKPDAFQYSPLENGLSAWQIFADGNAQGPVSQKFGAWNHVKLVAVGDSADIYFNSDEPVLHVPDLKTDIAAGRVGFWAFSLADETAYFSNVSIRPLRDGERLVGKPASEQDKPEGLIADWLVSSPFAEARIADRLSLTNEATADLGWRSLAVETNGIANLARLAPANENADTVFIKMQIKSARTRVAEMRFGYSDRVRIYVNGKRTYFGDAGWRVRDYRFLGTVGFFDSAGLDLKKGDNEILIAISETFGGWARAGAIEDRSGLEIR